MLDFKEYKTTLPYPKRTEYKRWRMSIIDTNSGIIEHNWVSCRFAIEHECDEVILQFIKDRVDSKAEYAEYGPHVFSHELYDGKTLSFENMRYKIGRSQKWRYCSNEFDLRFDTLGTIDPEYNRQMKLYSDDQHRLHEKFKSDLFEDLGISDNPRREKLFALAYEKGHHNGLESVYNYANDFADLII